MTNAELEQTITIYNNYLDRMSGAVRHLSEDLGDAGNPEGKMVLPALIEGLEWLNEAIAGFVEFGKIETSKQETFQNLLKKMFEALENKDYPLLQDLCEFELGPFLEELKIDDHKLYC